ncbi:P-loop ATPase, Sll1717 family [Paucidesulfovibrio longus]|uniref:P-loop ATPase, Sll1717 family n=1 Tax=Paucidesulfovibrio longus TaxID=889 RepID=UPI0003F614FD|nr:hypothetical protein [Paucidesulfovibrio longus]
MKNLTTLQQFFLSGTAEGDSQFLNRVFVPSEQLAELLSIPAGSPRLLIGNKGIGKTALLSYLNSIAKKYCVPTLLLAPDDLNYSNLGNNNDIATIKRILYNSLVHSVSKCIGTQLKGLLSADEKIIYDTAIAEGLTKPDLITNLASLLPKIGAEILKINSNSFAFDLGGNRGGEALALSVKKYLMSSNKLFFLFLDDIDQISSPDSSANLNRIWGLLLAARKLVQQNIQIRCIISVRTEVWTRLVSDDAGQRDQVDHFQPLVINLKASDDYIHSIIYKRIKIAAEELGYNAEDPWSCFFSTKEVTLPKSKETRKWGNFIIKSARQRPRDAIQLVHFLAKTALSIGHSHISDATIESSLVQYSTGAARYLVGEVGTDCNNFMEVIRSFADLDTFSIPFEKLKKHLSSMPSRFSLTIRGITLGNDRDNDFFTLLALLHESGFINPRVKDNSMPRGYNHITFFDDPYLVNRSRLNQLQQTLSWDIHPAFRSFLLDIQKDRFHA